MRTTRINHEENRSVENYIDGNTLKSLEVVNRPIHSIAFLCCLITTLGCVRISLLTISTSDYEGNDLLSPLTWIPCIYLQGFMHLNFIILQHEIVHGNVLPWERHLSVIYGILTPFSPVQFTRWHLDHHRHLGSPTKDPKRAFLSPNTSKTTNPTKKTSIWLKILYFTPALIPIYSRASSKAAKAHLYPPKLLQKIQHQKIRSFIFHIVVATYLIYYYGICGWTRAHLLPLTVGFPFAFAINRLGQHYDFDESKEYHIGTRVDGSFIWHVLFLNSNFHIEHHWFPNVPFYNLKRLNYHLQPFFREKGIPNYTYAQLLFCWFVQNAKPHSHWNRSIFCHSRPDGLINTVKVLIELSRIETAVPVIISVCCGYGRALIAMNKHRIDKEASANGSSNTDIDSLHHLCIKNLLLLLGSGILLNCASNMWNQWTDIINDRINKPNRPIIRGDASQFEAAFYGCGCFILSLFLSWQVLPIYTFDHSLEESWCAYNNREWYSFMCHQEFRKRQVFVIIFLAGFTTASYSFPTLGRLKSNAWTASASIALARGLLLSVIGSASIVDILPGGNGFIESWVLGLVMAIFLFGASVTKDFTDVEGDRVANCQTMPILYGKCGTLKLITPFFLFPWFLLHACRSIFHADPNYISLTAMTSFFLSMSAIYLLASDSSTFTGKKEAVSMNEGMNHVTWKVMYVCIMVAHLGTLKAYAIVQYDV